MDTGGSAPVEINQILDIRSLSSSSHAPPHSSSESATDIRGFQSDKLLRFIRFYIFYNKCATHHIAKEKYVNSQNLYYILGVASLFALFFGSCKRYGYSCGRDSDVIIILHRFIAFLSCKLTVQRRTNCPLS